MKDLISIVIPTYNLEHHIAACLDSVLAQTYPHIEVVVVDDGSSDQTAEVVKHHTQKDPRVKLICKENGGVTTARLRGVAEASGEWIGFVDGDDYVEPSMFERLLENAETYQAQISHCGYRMVYPNGKEDYYYNTGRVMEQDKGTALEALLSGQYIEPGLVVKLFRKELFETLLQGNVMDTDIRINEDLLMSYYLFREAEQTVYEDVCPYYYMLRKGSAATSHLNEHKLKDPLRVLELLIADTGAFPTAQAKVKQRRVYQLITSATMSYCEQKDLIAPYRRQARKTLRAEIGDVLKGQYCSRKMKIMALWAAVWPWSYGVAHAVVANLNGSAHKFDV